MAGVIMLSPKKRAAPSAPMTMITQRVLLLLELFCKTKAVSAKTPPSPWLSARMMISTYFTVTTKISAQVISDRTP